MALNVVQFPTPGKDIPQAARDWLQLIEAGDFPGMDTALVIFNGGGSLRMASWGQTPIPESIALLEIVKASLLRQVIGD